MSELLRLSEVMQRLRAECPWDAQQSHRSLVKHLIEEAAEVTEAIEAEPVSDADLCEELGDLLMQVYFHAEIARTEQRFDIEDVARGICDKLVARHPWVFDGAADPDKARAILHRTWPDLVPARAAIDPATLVPVPPRPARLRSRPSALH